MKFVMRNLLIGLAVFGVATSAYALRPYSGAVTYFDSTGAIIGVDIVNCTNEGWHAGVQNSTYFIYAQGACSGAGVNSTLLPGTGVIGYNLPGGETIEQGCTTANVQCLGGHLQPGTFNYPGLTWEEGWVDPTQTL
jgi:hypothetical protein